MGLSVRDYMRGDRGSQLELVVKRCYENNSQQACPLTLVDVARSGASPGARHSLLRYGGHTAVRGLAGFRAGGTTALPTLFQTARLSIRGLDTGDAAGAGAHGA